MFKLKSLGIDELVRDMELSALGEHVAARLREMTGKKRKIVNRKSIEETPMSIDGNAFIS